MTTAQTEWLTSLGPWLAAGLLVSAGLCWVVWRRRRRALDKARRAKRVERFKTAVRTEARRLLACGVPAASADTDDEAQDRTKVFVRPPPKEEVELVSRVELRGATDRAAPNGSSDSTCVLSLDDVFELRGDEAW